MGLKQSIVIKNEFTNKAGQSNGSRGNSPGQYVLRYMGREKATEGLTPVRLQDTEEYITRYMARKEASETLQTIPQIKDGMRKAQKDGGVAFGYGDVSLSDERLREVSKDIQANYDAGKTVMKTVISFDEEYLRQHGIIDEEFHCEHRGDYRGHIDQMKLRMAIMSGMERMARDYDDLQYVGVIQVDTQHVHCHLAMVDRGQGHMAVDGTQKGKLPESAKRQLRYGIDSYLDQEEKIRMMTSNLAQDKRNALCFIKKFTHKTMERHGTPQFLLACLPEDKTLWRAGTNRKEMRKANQIVREYVTEVLSQPDSGYREAMREVEQYARHRSQNEGLGARGYQRLVREGQARMMEDCMNGVYAVLKEIPDELRKVRTPMMSAMAMDYDEMAAQAASDPMMEFGFKLRSYSARLQYHKKQTHKFRDAKEHYDAQTDVSPDSQPMRDFFEYEENYNARLMCKYQYFLAFLPNRDDYEDEFEELMAYRAKVRKLRQMREDKAMKKMASEHAEEYGREVYDMTGGRYVRRNPSVLDRRQVAMEERQAEMEQRFRQRLADSGLTLDEKGVSTKKPFSFDEVKALDIHHLGYDWPYDVMVSKPNVDIFVREANLRYDLFQAAKDYLVQSGQAEAVSGLPERDVTVMKEVADRLAENGSVVAARPTGGSKRLVSTISLDQDYETAMKQAVRDTVHTVALEEIE